MAFEANDSKTLETIRQYLNAGVGGPDTAAVLIKEVRDALRGSSSEPTVRTSILNLENTIKSEFADLIATLRQSGNVAGGSRNSKGEIIEENQTKILKDILLAFEGMGGAGGAGPGGPGHGDLGPAAVFQRQVLIKTFTDTAALFQKINEGAYKVGDFLDTFRGLKTQQFNATFEGLLNNFIGFGLRMTNLSTAFEKLTHTVRETVASYGSNVFGSNILGPQEHFFELVNRVQKGILLDSDAFHTTVKSIQQSLEQGLASPLAMSGKTAAQLAEDFSLTRQAVRKMGTDLKAWGTTEQNQRWMLDLTDTMNKMGLNTTLHQPIMEQALHSQTLFLQKIAANTGISVDKLESILKKNADQNALMVALGQLRPEEKTRYDQAQTAFTGQIGQEATTVLFNLFKKVLAGGRPDQPGAIMASDPEFFAKFAAIPGAFQTTLKALDLIMKGQQEEALKYIRQYPEIFRELRERSLQQGNVLNQRTFGQEVMQTVAGLSQAGQIATAKRDANEEQRKRAETDPFAAIYGQVTQFYQNQIKPIFGGLEGAITKQLIAIGWNIVALNTLSARIAALPLAMGMARMGGPGIMGTIARGATMAAGGLAVGGMVGEGINMVSPPKSGGGEFGAIAGGAAGGLGGLMAGRFLGGILGAPLGPVGAAIGSVVLGYLGQKVGDYLMAPAKTAGEVAASAVVNTAAAATPPPQVVSPAAAAPAVPAPQNVVGPDRDAIAAQAQTTSDISRNYHGEQIQMLTGLLNAGVDGNNLLSQMYAELVRQTTALTGQPGTASTPLPAHGLSSNAPSFTSGARPQAAYPTGPVDA